VQDPEFKPSTAQKTGLKLDLYPGNIFFEKLITQ
jgi:hypothetical protein